MVVNKFVTAAQLYSLFSPEEKNHVKQVLDQVYQASDIARLDILITGGEEYPELFHSLTASPRRAAREVFLWYAVLADHPGLKPDHSIVNAFGKGSSGWKSAGTWEEAGENFMFSCPNHPEVLQAVLSDLERQLDTYPFDGVFLDKIRFPSPANGIDEVLSCFCPFCRKAAAQEGLDLSEVSASINKIDQNRWKVDPNMGKIHPADWIARLFAGLPGDSRHILQHFLRFRARSITRFVEEIERLTDRKGVQLALDLFSPCLAALVGQDYPSLARLAAWVKPMSYQYANGPAGLRLEVPRLVWGFEDLLQLPSGAGEQWILTHLAGFEGVTVKQIERDGAPLSLIDHETRRAVEWMGQTPVYMGIEAVSIPAFHIDIQPKHIRKMLSIAKSAGAPGAVLCWDLRQIPTRNLTAVHMD
jgi:hypothetical protein